MFLLDPNWWFGAAVGAIAGGAFIWLRRAWVEKKKAALEAEGKKIGDKIGL